MSTFSLVTQMTVTTSETVVAPLDSVAEASKSDATFTKGKANQKNFVRNKSDYAWLAVITFGLFVMGERLWPERTNQAEQVQIWDAYNIAKSDDPRVVWTIQLQKNITKSFKSSPNLPYMILPTSFSDANPTC